MGKCSTVVNHSPEAILASTRMGFVRVNIPFHSLFEAASDIKLISSHGALSVQFDGSSFVTGPYVIRLLMLAGSRQVVLRRRETWMRFLAQDEVAKPSILISRQRCFQFPLCKTGIG